MIPVASTWTAYVLLFGAVLLLILWRTRFAKAAVVAFIAAAILSLPAALMPLSNCAPWRPAPGEYAVLGARIDMDVAIHVFLSNGDGAPRCYTLPFSKSEAEGLQAALDGEGGVEATIGEEGGVQYDGEPPVTSDEHKRVERPLFAG